MNHPIELSDARFWGRAEDAPLDGRGGDGLKQLPFDGPMRATGLEGLENMAMLLSVLLA
ncbi:MAG: hypothetical protein AAFQ89_08460 [Cyanobacteria bacterium J06626_18]